MQLFTEGGVRSGRRTRSSSSLGTVADSDTITDETQTGLSFFTASYSRHGASVALFHSRKPCTIRRVCRDCSINTTPSLIPIHPWSPPLERRIPHANTFQVVVVVAQYLLPMFVPKRPRTSSLRPSLHSPTVPATFKMPCSKPRRVSASSRTVSSLVGCPMPLLPPALR